MKISILCSNTNHPVNAHLDLWMARNAGPHDIALCRQKADLIGGDILFLVSSTEIVHKNDRDLYSVCLVLHASDLPEGRGWSPHVWQLSRGARFLTMSLLEAEDAVDSGRIWQKRHIEIPRDALWDEINKLVFDAEIDLMDYAVANFGNVRPLQQDPKIDPTYFRRRTPADSKIDPTLNIEQQFDLIRVCDPTRFPAFFDLHGCRYKLTLEKIDDAEN